MYTILYVIIIYIIMFILSNPIIYKIYKIP